MLGPVGLCALGELKCWVCVRMWVCQRGGGGVWVLVFFSVWVGGSCVCLWGKVPYVSLGPSLLTKKQAQCLK